MSFTSLLRLLNQDEVWVTRDGAPVPLDVLTADQRAAALAWLTDRAGPLMEADWAPRNIGGNLALGLSIARMNGDVPDPMEWLHDQPLVQRLQSLVLDDEYDAEQGRQS